MLLKLQMSWQSLHYMMTSKGSVGIKGANIIKECACKDLPLLGCICMEIAELVLGSSPPFG